MSSFAEDRRRAAAVRFAAAALVLALAAGLVAYKQRAWSAARAGCAAAGGVYHCSDGGYRSCDCYRPDGRVLLFDGGAP